MKASAKAMSYVGLRDPQGFLELNEGAYEPLRLIDVHTSWNAVTGRYGTSGVADEILEVASNHV